MVVVSRAWFETSKPNPRDSLLNAGDADDRDEFDDILDG